MFKSGNSKNESKHLKKEEEIKKPTSNSQDELLTLHGDDSSDEETSDCSEYDLSKAWSSFKNSNGFKKLLDVSNTFVTVYKKIKPIFEKAEKLLQSTSTKQYILDNLISELEKADLPEKSKKTIKKELTVFLEPSTNKGKKAIIDEIKKHVKNLDTIIGSAQINELDVFYAFIAQAIGIKYLYSPEVNDLYYKSENGKKSLGTNKFISSEESVISWIKAAIEQTWKLLFDGTAIESNLSESQLIENTAKEIHRNIRQLLKEANIKDAGRNLNDTIKSISPDIEQSETLFPNNIRNSANILAQSMKCDTSKSFIDWLINLPKTLTDTSKKAINNNTQDINEYFKKILYYQLAVLRPTCKIEFSRGINEPVVYDLSSTSKGSLLFFGGIRRNNRYNKRKLKHHEHNLASYSLFSEKNKGSGYPIQHYTYWIMPNKDKVLQKDDITTNLNRASKIIIYKSKDKYGEIREGSEYPELYERIKNANENSIQENMNYIRELIQGNNPTNYKTKDEKSLKILTKTCSLLFLCEPTRHPASFVTHQMMLDLIQKGTPLKNIFANYKEDKTRGGDIPMSMAGAVRCARRLNKLFALYMPVFYSYEGEIENNIDNIAEFIKRTSNLVQKWRENCGNMPKLKKRKATSAPQDELPDPDIYNFIIGKFDKEWYKFNLHQEQQPDQIATAVSIDGSKDVNPRNTL